MCAPTVGAPATLGRAFGTGRSIAALGTGFVTGSTDGATDADRVARATLWNATFAAPKPLKLEGVNPIVAASKTEFNVAVGGSASSDLPQFYIFDVAGKLKCGPVKFADGKFVPSAITVAQSGYLVVSSDSVRVQELSDMCAPGASFTVASATGSEHVGIAAGTNGYGVVWQRKVGTTVTPMRRIFGSRYCD